MGGGEGYKQRRRRRRKEEEEGVKQMGRSFNEPNLISNGP
jgi:hypothetical protein